MSSSDAFGSTTDVLATPPCGPIKGISSDGVRIFRGVPFAQPPVGSLRFLPPVKPTPWTSPRDATHLPPAPMQEGEMEVPKSEDCLYLNIWTPEGDGPFPVFVWIHGGGFTGGYAGEGTYDGTQFAKDGIICVTVEYRLGIFGFLDVEPLLGSTYAGSANNGLRDLVMALEWVHESISAFGGDPGRVTIGGESAGAKLTDILMGVPSAKPYFHQMVSESGGAERVLPAGGTVDVSTSFGAEWSKRSGQDIAAIATASASSLIEVQGHFLGHYPKHFPLRPVVDGTFLPALPIETIARGSTHGKRLLIGTNRDESSLFIGPHPAKDPTTSDLGNVTLAQFLSVYEKYKDLFPESTDELRRIRAVTAEEYWVPSMRVVDAHRKGGGKAWMYRLDFSQTSGDQKGYAYHSLDVGLVWNRPNKSVANAAEEAELATIVSQAWKAFIRGEAPKSAGLPLWPEYRSNSRQTMILDNVSRTEEKPQEKELRLWDGIL